MLFINLFISDFRLVYGADGKWQLHPGQALRKVEVAPPPWTGSEKGRIVNFTQDRL